jgi:signal transduction histidine kinase
MQNNYLKNKSLFSIIGALLALSLTLIVWKFDFPKLDAFFYDLHATAFKRHAVSAQLKLVHLTPESDNDMRFTQFSLKTHQQIISDLFNNGAKNVFYAIDPHLFDTHEKDFPLDKFVEFTKKYPNLYFLIPSTFNNLRTTVFNHAVLSKLNFIENIEGTDMISGASDWVVRRILLGYENSAFPYQKIFGFDPRTLQGKFLRNDYACIRATFAPKGSYDSVIIRNNSGIELLTPHYAQNNWIFVGLNSKFDLFDYRKIPFDHSSYAMNYNEVLANAFDTVIRHDHPKVPLKFVNYFWTFINLFLFLYCALKLSARKLFIFSFLQLALVIIIPLLGFGLTSWQLDTTKTFLILFLLQYLAIPFVFIKLARQNDRNLEEKEKAINKAKITVKSAKADLGFRIASQVAHDLKSPIMGLETVKMLTRSEIKEDVRRLLENSINRINSISDSLLKKFRSGTFETMHEDIPIDIIAVIEELIHTFDKTHPRISIQLNTPSKQISILINQADIERAITNILNNAIEAMSFTGIIHIEIEDDNDFTNLIIKDSGSGIPPQLQNDIFKAGFTHGKETGSGIGLSQAKEAFQKFGGDVSLVSSREGETIFKLILPKTNLKTIEIDIAENVILVEDNEETRSIWKNIFSDNKVNFNCYNSFKEFQTDMVKKSFRPFSDKKFTVITDLIFDNEDETGFDVIQITTQFAGELVSNSFLCSTLSSNPEIAHVAADLGIKIFSKKNLGNIKIRVI